MKLLFLTKVKQNATESSQENLSHAPKRKVKDAKMRRRVNEEWQIFHSSIVCLGVA